MTKVFHRELWLAQAEVETDSSSVWRRVDSGCSACAVDAFDIGPRNGPPPPPESVHQRVAGEDEDGGIGAKHEQRGGGF